MHSILAYTCDYCGVIKKTETIMKNHEKTCLKNPDAINCLLCENRSQKMVDGIIIDFCKIHNKKCSKSVSAKCNNFNKVL